MISFWSWQWNSLLSWWQWGVLMALPPAVILLYFLKLKRQPLQVPSTYLWRKSIEDLHVNSLWQRLRQNLLLYLQLLLLGMLILALLGPSWNARRLLGDRFIFMVDASASMGSLDEEKTRLETAKQRVGELIDEMRSGDVAMIVSFSDQARIVQHFTDNRRLLKERLEAVGQTARPTSIDEALRAASGSANPGRTASDPSDVQVADALPATVYIFSDGKFEDVSGFSLGNLQPEYRPLGADDASNVGVVAFDARRNEEYPDQLQAFARLQNFGEEDRTVEVELYLDSTGGQPLDVKAVQVPAEGAAGVEFRLGNIEQGVLRLVAKTEDAFRLDDEAWAAVNPPRQGRVLLVTPGNEALQMALLTEDAEALADVSVAPPSILKDEQHQRDAAAGKYHLIIYDRCQPVVGDDPERPWEAMPEANTLFIGTVPPIAGWKSGDVVSVPQIIDTNRAHPLMHLVELGNVMIVEGTPLESPPGGTPLIDSTQGSLFSIAARGAHEDAVLGFEIVGQREGQTYVNTNWPLRLSFPVFVLNVLQYSGGGERSLATAHVQPGQTIPLLAGGSVERLNVRTPQGQTLEVPRNGIGGFTFSRTDTPGIYEVLEDDKLQYRFAVNLFSPNESDIRPRPENTIKIGYVEVEGKPATEAARAKAWKLFLGLALVVLLVEWYIYNRRVYL